MSTVTARPRSTKRPRDRRRENGAGDTAVNFEEAVVGGLLTGAPWSEVSPFLRVEHFAHQPLALVYGAISTCVANGMPSDVITVAEQLDRAGHLRAAGGRAALTKLACETITTANTAAYARVVRDRSDSRRLRQVVEESDDADRLSAAQRLLSERAALEAAAAPAIALRHIADIVEERREPEWLNGLHKILERRVIAVLAGYRSTLKSFIGMHWSMIAAISGESVVILSGEGAGLGRRAEAWMRTHAPAKNVRDLRLLVLERAINLNLAETMYNLQGAIDAVAMTPALIVIDTLSKFTPGMKENASEETAAFLFLVSTALREHFGCTALIVAHAGHGDAKRPRGSSVLMANPDAEYMVERPDPTAMAVTVTRERFKDCPALPPLAYTADVIDLGRLDRYSEPITSLVMRDAGVAAVAAAGRPELRGKAQRQLLAALKARSGEGAGIWTIADLREIARQAGIHKNSARDAAEALTFSAHLTATVGGWSLRP